MACLDGGCSEQATWYRTDTSGPCGEVADACPEVDMKLLLRGVWEECDGSLNDVGAGDIL